MVHDPEKWAPVSRLREVLVQSHDVDRCFGGRRQVGKDHARENKTMQFMVIERFRNRDAKAVYRRFREQGRMAPDGLKYVGSWIETNFDRCFQIMECDDARLLQEWIANWSDLVDFEVVPVVTSEQTRETILPRL
jgi:hypothetical protein